MYKNYNEYNDKSWDLVCSICNLRLLVLDLVKEPSQEKISKIEENIKEIDHMKDSMFDFLMKSIEEAISPSDEKDSEEIKVEETDFGYKL
jgi:uncharacterized membrane protein